MSVNPFTLTSTLAAPTDTSDMAFLPSSSPISDIATSADSKPTITSDGKDCAIYIGSSVYVYYWPTGTPNTACLSGLPPEATAPPPDIPNLYSNACLSTK